MKWKKLGVIWQPEGNLWWAKKYATCPTPLFRQDGSLRIYLQSRDALGVGRVGYVDVDPHDPLRIIRIAQQPVLDIGAPGAFDDNGVFQTSVLQTENGRLMMYYVGFELCHHIRYRLLTGLAVSDDGGDSFQKVINTPILERSTTEMHIRGGAFVLRTATDSYQMWYVAGSEWEQIADKAMPVYDIRYAESADGIHWPSEGQVVLPIERTLEHGFGRPYVIKNASGYQMFYSIRKKSPCAYRMGYA